jgi:hypothetical protein
MINSTPFIVRGDIVGWGDDENCSKTARCRGVEVEVDKRCKQQAEKGIYIPVLWTTDRPIRNKMPMSCCRASCKFRRNILNEFPKDEYVCVPLEKAYGHCNRLYSFGCSVVGAAHSHVFQY